MPIELDTLEQRIVGVLIEKQLAVPESYPMTLNALVAGCNQKSNRDPVMAVEDYEVEGALRSLMDKQWVTRPEAVGARVMRYAHEATAQLGVEPADLAILSELLCRGPQAPGALKTRAGRMRPFASPAEVEASLEALASRPVPYVERLPRQPRERQARWRHLLGKAEPVEAEAPAPAAERPSVAPQAPTTEERLAELEQRVEELADRLDRLERGDALTS
jgi:uncharacterized protein YceH (UPF0502 family)